MADSTDVANALVALIAATAYPNGTGQSSIAPGAAPVLVYQGWPIAPQLDVDLRAGKIHVSVFPTATERVTESNASEIQDATLSAATVGMTVVGVTVTVDGVGGAGQNAALLVDGVPFVYAVQASDTATSIATALVALVTVKRAASNTGAVITIPNAKTISARVGVQGTGIRVLQRREKIFQVSVWANSFTQRDPFAGAIDAALTDTYRLTMPDGSQGLMRYRSSVQHDDTQKASIYRRDMLYAVEYCLTNTVVTTQIVIEQLGVSVPVATQSVTLYS
jgi:hypothetical protein